MQLYSTKNKSKLYSLEEAVMLGLPPDNGLFMPLHIPKLPKQFFKEISGMSFQDIAFLISQLLIAESIPKRILEEIIHKAINFPAPLIGLDDNTSVLELFHGPSMAFKDFGARFMSQIMGYFNEGNSKMLTILVATSGDTGGAVAAGFYDTLGIEVIILYPKGKVSAIQEKQLTTFGKNISAIEVNGSFDDCQAIVKQSFLDEDLKKKFRLSSANSINIARLIPQSFYYFEAYKQLKNKENVVFSIPSGNFGNLTAGVFAKKMGLPISDFIAATNLNDIIPNYLITGEYLPKPSLRTMSNAMDVGDPSNFRRLKDIYKSNGSTWNNMRDDIKGLRYDDMQTKSAIKEVDHKYNYTIDPHAAVAYLAFREYQNYFPDTNGIILETAHPAKFLDDMEATLGRVLDIPENLISLLNKQKVADSLPKDFSSFKEWILSSKV